jgi:hypothetical protein
MDENRQNRLPAIIVDYISKLNDPTINIFTKEIYASHLQRVIEASTFAIQNFNATKHKKKAVRK